MFRFFFNKGRYNVFLRKHRIMITPYKFKNITHEITDLDEKKGIVVAYANVYDVKDSDGDISAKGSFVKTSTENYQRIGVFKNHNPNISLGIPLELDAKDSYGLRTVTKFDTSITDGQDMYNHIVFKKENNRNTELSIGYEVMKRDEKNRAIITEYKLWEYSFLTHWAANSASIVEDVKSLKTRHDILDTLCKMYDRNYSDQTIQQIEKILKSLDNKEPFESNTPTDEPTPEQIKETLIKAFNNVR